MKPSVPITVHALQYAVDGLYDRISLPQQGRNQGICGVSPVSSCTFPMKNHVKNRVKRRDDHSEIGVRSWIFLSANGNLFTHQSQTMRSMRSQPYHEIRTISSPVLVVIMILTSRFKAYCKSISPTTIQEGCSIHLDRVNPSKLFSSSSISRRSCVSAQGRQHQDVRQSSVSLPRML